MPKLLLVDDSPTTQKVVQLTFADEGIAVVVADDGDTAMELFNHHKPDVVLADINIPGLNGYEVCEAIRKHEGNGRTPVILLAGSFEPFNVEEARRVGATDYLTKPFSSIRRLVATVTALLDSVAKEDSTVDETVQPDNVPIAVAPGPGGHATNDIEQLYSQSFAETIEMPQAAERAAAAAGGVVETERPGIADEAAFDDGLIETTFTEPPQEETYEAPQQDTPVEPEQETAVPSPEETAYTESVETASVLADDTPQDHGGFELVVDSQNGAVAYEEPSPEEEIEQVAAPPSNIVQFSDLVQRDAPTEEFVVDQSGDETYFEPESETIKQPVMTEVPPEPPSPIFLDESYAAENESQLIESVSAELNSFEPTAVESAETPEIEAPAPLSYEIPATEPETSTQNEHTTLPTPWDSVAEPKTATYSFDDVNLLEIPIPGGQYRPMGEVNDLSAKTSELSAEVVEQIVKATATQISEELVREIAARIVPKVIEEVMARKDAEDIDR